MLVILSNVNINNDDVMMTELTILEKCTSHSQVVNSWLPSWLWVHQLNGTQH